MLQDYASGSRPLIDAALARNGIQANIVQEIGHPATLFPMVAAGIGISILPALALPLPEGSPLVVKRITPVVERQLMLVRRKNRSLSTAAQALWDVVRGQGRALMAGREGGSAVSDIDIDLSRFFQQDLEGMHSETNAALSPALFLPAVFATAPVVFPVG